MYNQKGSMVSKSIIFNVEKCIDPDDKPGYCKTENEIKEFINEMTVEMWIIESQLDMRYFHGESH